MKKRLTAVTFLTSALLLSIPAWSADDEFYYQIGGGEPVTRSATNRPQTLEIGGSVAWSTDLMCGNFDVSLSVEQQLQGIKGAFSDLMSNVINSATGAVASLPALIIQRTNPALYDLLQNGVLQASREFQIAKTSCEDMGDRMADVILGGGWEEASRGGYWAGQATGGAEILETHEGADRDGLDNGVIWVEGAMRGGRGQPPIEIVGDTAKAGYNQLLQRNPGNTLSTTGQCADAPICDTWASPQQFADWMIAVVGETKIRTCEACDKVASQAGMGLSHQIGLEQERIATELEVLVGSRNPPTADELRDVSGGANLLISRRVIEAIREEPAHEQAVIVNRLGAEMALSLTMERAMMARRALLAGRKEPNIANLQVAQDQLAPFLDELDQEIHNILFELEVRQRVASNTASQLLLRDRARSNVPIVENVPESLFEDGAVIEP